MDKDKEINIDRDIQLCQGHDEEMPLPKLDDKLFNKVALPKAKEAVEEYFYYLGYDHARMNDIFEYIIDELYERCNEDKLLMAIFGDKTNEGKDASLRVPHGGAGIVLDVKIRKREEKAKERIFSLLPDDQKAELSAIFDEFEACETPESKFAHSMDNLQPLILNNSNNGNDWKEHGVAAAQVYERQGKTQLGSQKLFEVTDSIIKENIAKGNLK